MPKPVQEVGRTYHKSIPIRILNEDDVKDHNLQCAPSFDDVCSIVLAFARPFERAH